MTFADLNLNKPLLRALDELGYTNPTPIQEAVFSVVMSGRDVCGMAQTGTGKTLAYLLPCLRQFQFAKDRSPQIVVLVPTRELVVQVVETVKSLSAYLNLVVAGIYGGVNFRPQLAEVQQGVDVLVATPGRLVDLLSSGGVKMKALRRLVIDEADEMLDLGFRPQLMTILDLLPPKRQTLLFSATLTPDVEQLLDAYVTNPARVEAAPVGTPLTSINQVLYRVPTFYTKVNLLNRLLSHPPTMNRVLVFVATRHLADQLYAELEADWSEQVGVVHASKAQQQRFAAVDAFQAGHYRVLIATDVLARGLDVAGVSHVINFDVPDQPETYIHRIGRTGRADQRGEAITFVTERETEFMAAIERLMNYTVPELPLPAGLVISDVLTDDEKPRVAMKIIDVKTPDRSGAGAAFHEKIDKNKKVNVRRDYAAEKAKKYGRPIKRSGKK